MMQLRLTGKLQKALGLKPQDLSEITDYQGGLGHWTANQFSEDGRTCLIFINDKTLYSFMLFDVREDNIKDIRTCFIKGLIQLLILDGFAESEIDYLLSDYDEIQFTKTHSKQVLANLNDLTRLYQDGIFDEGGFGHANITQLISRYNRMPQKNLGWAFAIDAVKKIVAQRNCT